MSFVEPMLQNADDDIMERLTQKGADPLTFIFSLYTHFKQIILKILFTIVSSLAFRLSSMQFGVIYVIYISHLFTNNIV